MTYQTLMDELFSKRTRKVAKTQQQMEAVVQFLGHPQANYPSIHIAGTNGKGSVALKMAKSLELSGYKVGLFTSPHIQSFTERIQVNGVQISPEEIMRYLPSLLKTFPDLCFFDYVTFLAFQYFRDQQVDVGVFEAGIGGLHDTTNLIRPLVAIITSISNDHIELLGPTLNDIAQQKAGIIKYGIPAVIGPEADFLCIDERAAFLKSPLIRVPYQPGDYDQENQAIAKAALLQLKARFALSDQALRQGLLEKPPCRFERIGRFVLDVAHNPAGFKNLLKAWKIHHCERRFNAIVGLSAEKDLAGCLKQLASEAEHLYLVQAESARAASTAQLAEILQREGASHFTPCQTISDAIKQALACDHDILICGSFYIMKHAREQVLRL